MCIKTVRPPCSDDATIGTKKVFYYSDEPMTIDNNNYYCTTIGAATPATERFFRAHEAIMLQLYFKIKTITGIISSATFDYYLEGLKAPTLLFRELNYLQEYNY